MTYLLHLHKLNGKKYIAQYLPTVIILFYFFTIDRPNANLARMALYCH